MTDRLYRALLGVCWASAVLAVACGEDELPVGEQTADEVLSLTEVQSAIAATGFEINRGGDVPPLGGGYGALVSITESTIGTAGNSFSYATCYYGQTSGGELRQRAPASFASTEVINYVTGDGEAFTIYRDASTSQCEQYSIISGARLSEDLLFASFLAVYAPGCIDNGQPSGDYERGDMFLSDLGNGLDCPLP